MSAEVCGYYTLVEELEGETLVQSYKMCSRDVEVTYVDPLDGFRYPLCHRHNGRPAQRASERLGYVAERPVSRAN